MKSMIKYQFCIDTQTHILALYSKRTSTATSCERKKIIKFSFFHAVHQKHSTSYKISAFDIVIFLLYSLVYVSQAILSFVQALVSLILSHIHVYL